MGYVDGVTCVELRKSVAVGILFCEVNALVEKVGVNVVITSSIPAEEASETVKKYL